VLRSRIKLLSLTVGATVVLLAVGAFLVVLGIFDNYLGWDIFSPQAEKVLYGLFFTCLALGGFGAAIAIVLGIQEVVKALRRMIAATRPEAAEPVQEIPRRAYLAVTAALLVLLASTVGAMNVVNRRVEASRLATFKLIVKDQMRQLGPRLKGEIAKIQAPCATCAPATLVEMHRTLEGLSFCGSAVFFMADPVDGTVLWRFPATVQFNVTTDGAQFERRFVADDIDRAVQQALTGDTAWIDQMNGAPAFNWYQAIRDDQGKVRAVLKIYGNPNESYRDYQAVAAAAKGS
jgi:hypothetical protein